MALTPRSFLRSPTMLVALLISAGIALLGSALFLATFCSKAEQTRTVVVKRTVDPLSALRGGGCDHLLRENGSALAVESAGFTMGIGFQVPEVKSVVPMS